jgi:hypothetical protein
MIRCDEALRELDEHVDDTLGAARAAELAAHLRACAACRAAETRTRRLLAAAAALPAEVAPARDLWPDIAARLRAAVVASAAARRRRGGRRRVLLAAAALALVAVTAAVTSRLTLRAPVPAPSGGAAVPLAAAGGADLAAAAAEYEHAAQALRSALAGRRAGLPAGTLRVVDENLAVIDAAVAELTRALAAAPGDRTLTTLLAATWARRIELLETANRLSNT